jgi:hypothetical protein
VHSRWIRRHHGRTIAGPPAADLVDEATRRRGDEATYEFAANAQSLGG